MLFRLFVPYEQRQMLQSYIYLYIEYIQENLRVFSSVGLDHDVMIVHFCVSPPAGSGTGHANRVVVVVSI